MLRQLVVYGFVVFACWAIVQAFWQVGGGGGDPHHPGHNQRHGPF
jgi:hypothetical protein